MLQVWVGNWESIINKVNVPPQINSISFIRENFSDASIKRNWEGTWIKGL